MELMNMKFVSIMAVGLVILGLLLTPLVVAQRSDLVGNVSGNLTRASTPIPPGGTKLVGNATPMAYHGNATGVPTSGVGEPLGVQRNLTTSMNRTPGQV